MEVSVYYRGAMGKLCQINVEHVEDHAAAIKAVEDGMDGDLFAKKPFLAMIPGGKK